MLRSYIAFDIETTGLSPQEHEIIEIGALKVRDGKVAERFTEFIKPASSIPPIITGLTGISDEMVCGARTREHVVPDFLDFCGQDILIGHNVIFDYSFIKVNAQQLGYEFEREGIDTLKIARAVHQDLPSKSLSVLCEHYNIENAATHRAYHDALATAKLYQTLSHYFEEKEPKVFKPSPLVCTVKKSQPATKKQLDFLRRLIKQKGLKDDFDMESMTRNEASRLIDSILSGTVS